MKEISIVIDDKDEVTFKTKGFENPIEALQILNFASNQLLTSLKVRNSGVIKPSMTINQAFSKGNGDKPLSNIN